MSLKKFICIPEGNYEDNDPWDAEGIVVESCSARDAACNYVTHYPDELGPMIPMDIGEQDDLAILVKDVESGKIVRCILVIEASISIKESTIDRSFHLPWEDAHALV